MRVTQDGWERVGRCVNERTCIHQNEKYNSSFAERVITGYTDTDFEYGGAFYRWYSNYRRDDVRREVIAYLCDDCTKELAGACAVCGQEKAIDRDHCAECARAFAVSAQSDVKLAAFRDSILAGVKAHVDSIRPKFKPKTEEPKHMTISEDKIKKTPLISDATRSEADEGVWQGLIAALTEKGRDALASLLTMDMDPKRGKVAHGYFMEAFRGRWGVPVVAAVMGGGMHAAEQRGYSIPFVTLETASRIGREFRILGFREVTKNVVGSGTDLLAKYGGGIIETLTSIGKLADAANGDRIKVTPVE